MRESYFQPVLVIQSFKISDSLMASSRECHSMWCSPNGMPSQQCPANAFCPANCYACNGADTAMIGWNVDYGTGFAQ